VRKTYRNIILIGDVRENLREIPDGVVDCCVTSPPYWGLRDYKTEPLIWGGRVGCEHEWSNVPPRRKRKSTDVKDPESKQATNVGTQHELPVTNFCTNCGAWRGSLGLEPTPELYIEHMVEICREMRRTLKPWGVFWLNMGDSFNGSGGAGGDYNVGGLKEGQPKYPGRRVSSLKPKDLCMIPHRLALALQAHGWWVRMDVVWQKLNPMPESVNGWRWARHQIPVVSATYRKRDGLNRKPSGPISDANECRWKDCPGCDVCTPNGGFVLRKGSWRPTRSHEYIFMLTKSGEYYGDCEAVREELKQSSLVRIMQPTFDKQHGGPKDYGSTGTNVNRSARRTLENLKEKYSKQIVWDERQRGWLARDKSIGRNRRSVWSFATQSFKGAHFATFPTTLPNICIRASTSAVGNCPKCGMPWTRVLVPTPEYKKLLGGDWSNPNADESEGRGHFKKNGGAKSEQRPVKRDAPSITASYITLDYQPSCDCPNDLKPVPAIVLDPFVGSGTTAATAKGLGRDYIGIELNETYAKELAEPRIALMRRGSLLHPPIQKKKAVKAKNIQQLEISC
jgi:DNA modification methylase